MSKWLNVARLASPDLFSEHVQDNASLTAEAVSMPHANSAVSANSDLSALTVHGAGDEKSPVICIFCGEPVERGIPGTGSLAGQDLHMSCYRRRYPDGKR